MADTPEMLSFDAKYIRNVRLPLVLVSITL